MLRKRKRLCNNLPHKSTDIRSSQLLSDNLYRRTSSRIPPSRRPLYTLFLRSNPTYHSNQPRDSLSRIRIYRRGTLLSRSTSMGNRQSLQNQETNILSRVFRPPQFQKLAQVHVDLQQHNLRRLSMDLPYLGSLTLPHWSQHRHHKEQLKQVLLRRPSRSLNNIPNSSRAFSNGR